MARRIAATTRSGRERLQWTGSRTTEQDDDVNPTNERRDMTTTSSRWALAIALGVTATSACGSWQVRATDGTVQPDMTAAVRASAAHDLHCTKDVVGVRDVSANDAHEFVAEGCGGKATYRISNTEPHEVVVISQSPSAPALP
jgi:hypothetical protein